MYVYFLRLQIIVTFVQKRPQSHIMSKFKTYQLVKNIQFEWRTDGMSHVTLTIELVLVRVSYQSNSRVMVGLRASNTLVETAQQVQS